MTSPNPSRIAYRDAQGVIWATTDGGETWTGYGRNGAFYVDGPWPSDRIARPIEIVRPDYGTPADWQLKP